MVYHLNIYSDNKEMVNFRVCIYLGVFQEYDNAIGTYCHALYENMYSPTQKNFLAKVDKLFRGSDTNE